MIEESKKRGPLSKGGQEVQCGWLRDKFGLSWQVVPADLISMMAKDQKKSEQMMKALIRMVKLDWAKLKQAFDRP